jgi:hypothetical protein
VSSRFANVWILTVVLVLSGGIGAWLSKRPEALVVSLAGIATGIGEIVRTRLNLLTAKSIEDRVQNDQNILLIKGKLPLVEHINDCTSIGVHPAARIDGVSRVPPYVNRQIDNLIYGALDAPSTFVLIEGPSAAGKSRTAFEAVRRCKQKRQILIPKNGAALQAFLLQQRTIGSLIIWLDDIERFLGPDGLDEHLLNRVFVNGKSVSIMATLRSEARKQILHEHTDGAGIAGVNSRNAGRILDRATTFRLTRILMAAERKNITDRHLTDARLREYTEGSGHKTGIGLAEHLAVAPALLQRWQSGSDGANLAGAAIVSVLVDIRRMGIGDAVSVDFLRNTYINYVTLNERYRVGLPGVFEAGLDWATAPVHGASACVSRTAAGSCIAFDYLVDYAQRERRFPPVKAILWQEMLACSNATASFSLGTLALDHGQAEIAHSAFRAGTESSNNVVRAQSMFNLSIYLERQGKDAEGISWCMQAAELKEPRAIARLAKWHGEQGRANDEEKWLRVGVDLKDPTCIFSLAMIRESKGDDTEAAELYRTAAEYGEVKCITNLARLHLRNNNATAAESLFKEAAERGDKKAWLNLAVMYITAVDDARYRDLIIDALKAADDEPMAAIIAVSKAYGRIDDLVDVARTRAIRGDAAALYITAVIGFNDDYEGGAVRAMLEDSAAKGYGPARAELAFRFKDEGRLDEAALMLEGLAASGDVTALYNLGAVEYARGDDEAAEYWYRRASDMDDRQAMGSLGDLLLRRGDIAGGEHWLQSAVVDGDPPALNILLRHYATQCDFVACRNWVSHYARNRGLRELQDIASLAQLDEMNELVKVIDDETVLALPTWAEEEARARLAHDFPKAWHHARSVAARAIVATPLFDESDRCFLIAAAYLHEVAFGQRDDQDTGLHALDSAVRLTEMAAPDRLCALVAHHLCARVQAEILDLADVLDEWHDESTPVRDALWWADLTIAEDGAIITVDERIAEIRNRYGPGHEVTEHFESASSMLRGAVERTEQRLRAVNIDPLSR